jgi:YD repeat-containing protein
MCITDAWGRQLSFERGPLGELVRAWDVAGNAISYVYDARGRLVEVRFADGNGKKYLYGESDKVHETSSGMFLLTGIVDVTARGDESRFATFTYIQGGKVFSSEHAGGADRHSFRFLAYGDPGRYSWYSATGVTGPSGSEVVARAVSVAGSVHPSGDSQPAGSGCGPASSSITYDTQANVTSRTDFNGSKTCYAYDLSRNLETKRVEGLPSGADCTSALSSPPAGARVITQQWHPDWHFITRVAEPKKLTTLVYNGQGATCAPSTVLVDGKPPAVVCSRTEQATTDETGSAGFNATPTGTARTWRYTYTTYGRVLTATDPNGNVTTTTYHPDNDADIGRRGQIASVTNPAGHVTTTTDYNPHSQPTRSVDPNGLVTVLTYDLRQRLTSRTVGNETTAFGYDPVGQLTRVTLPDGAQVNYSYDAAHRLTGISDTQGNKIVYTLDAMGNRIKEQASDPGGALVRNIERAIDALGRVSQVTGRE